jgi:hypothetical protein
VKKKLVVFITTSQSPHFEVLIEYAQDSLNYYEKVYVINLLSSLRYRHELSYRNYLPIFLNLSRFLRNGINKKIYFIHSKTKNKSINYINFSKVHQGDLIISEEDIFTILKSYSSTEWRAAALRINKYTSKIQSDIVLVSKRISTLFFKLKFDRNCDFAIFNGRHPVENSIVTTLAKLGCTNFIYNECNNYQNKSFFRKEKIHNLSSYYDEIYQYYEQNKENLLGNYFKYTKVKGGEEVKDNIITYFSNNADEYQFTFKNPIQQSKIVADLLEEDFNGFSLKIRVHPNTKNKSKEARGYWDRLKVLYPQQIINYNENISSHVLCKKSILTTSIGSSMAAESIILGTPHVLIGDQNWHHRFPGYILCNENNFMKVLKNSLREYSKNKIYFSDIEQQLAAASFLFKLQKGVRIKCAPLGKYPTKEISLDFD